MTGAHQKMKEAIFDRFNTTPTPSWSTLSKTYDLPITQIRRGYNRWLKTPPESQPLSAKDIHIPDASPGRPCQLDKNEEQLLADAVRLYAKQNPTLTPTSVRDLVQEFVRLLPEDKRRKVKFFNGRPSRNWLKGFMRRNDLEKKSVKIVENRRVQALTKEHVADHIGRVEAIISRYNIKSPKYIFNLDQSGCSFERMTGRSLRKGVGPRNVALISSSVRTKGNLEHVTIMPVVSANGFAYKPVVVFPGVQRHYRTVKGERQTLQDYLPSCYLYQREMPGVNTDIMFDWAKRFVRETMELRAGGKYLLLILDGYAAHFQFKTLNLLSTNRILAVALPSHLSHVLQPLDVSVFSAYKSYLQREIHNAARMKDEKSKLLDAFDIAECITNAYVESLSCRNIRSGFARTGIWVPSFVGPSIEPLVSLFTNSEDDSDATLVTLGKLMESFESRGRTLIKSADVEDSGTIRVNTASGCHLTQKAVLDALHLRDLRKKSLKTKAITQTEAKSAYRESTSDVRRLVELAPSRSITRKKLNLNRRARREHQLNRIATRVANQIHFQNLSEMTC